jgi:hypothetical protein
VTDHRSSRSARAGNTKGSWCAAHNAIAAWDPAVASKRPPIESADTSTAPTPNAQTARASAPETATGTPYRRPRCVRRWP